MKIVLLGNGECLMIGDIQFIVKEIRGDKVRIGIDVTGEDGNNDPNAILENVNPSNSFESRIEPTS